jgi:hypothetical protein
MVTREEYFAASPLQQRLWLLEALRTLEQIYKGEHPLTGTRQAGRIAYIRNQMTQFVLNVAEWTENELA